MINWVQVRQLEEDVGAEDFGDVVSLFLAEVDQAVAQLDTIPRDPDALAPALHFLRGSAYNLGFQAFGDYCSEGEKLSLGGRIHEVELTKVAALYCRSKQAFFAGAASHCSFQHD